MTLLTFPVVCSVGSRSELNQFLWKYSNARDYDLKLVGSRQSDTIFIREMLCGSLDSGETVVGRGKQVMQFPVIGKTLEDCISYDCREKLLGSSINLGKYVCRVSNIPVQLYLSIGIMSYEVPLCNIPLLRFEPELINPSEHVVCPYS